VLYRYRLGRAPTPSIDESDTEEESGEQESTAVTETKKETDAGDDVDAKATSSKTDSDSKTVASATNEPRESKPSTSQAKQSDEGSKSVQPVHSWMQLMEWLVKDFFRNSFGKSILTMLDVKLSSLLWKSVILLNMYWCWNC
jgi:hypothetical protein